MTMYAIGEAKYDLSSFCAIATTLRIDGPSRLGRRLRGLLGRELEEDLLEAHPHRPELQQPPSRRDDGARQLAPDILPPRALDLVPHHAVAPIRFDDARHAGDGCEPRAPVRARPHDLHVHRLRSPQARRP